MATNRKLALLKTPFVILVLGLLYTEIVPTSSKILPNLRQFRMKGTIGSFLVPRDVLQAVINNRTGDDSECGNDVSLSLPQSIPSVHYDESLYGELLLSYGTLEEKHLDYLPCDLKENLETSYRSLYISVPFQTNDLHGSLLLVELTEARNRLTPPILTNDKYRITVDAIEEDEDTVTLRIGDDSMTLNVLNGASCNPNGEIGKDFDQFIGKHITRTCYPERFDWGCDSVLGWDKGYCKVIKENLCQIRRSYGDVCIYVTTRSSIRCPSTMKITFINGVFRDILPGLFETLPSESIECEWIDRVQDAGIKYPCLTPG